MSPMAAMEFTYVSYQEVAGTSGKVVPPPGRGGETAPAGAAERGRALTAEGLDRAVQRDARRYDGGFSLY